MKQKLRVLGVIYALVAAGAASAATLPTDHGTVYAKAQIFNGATFFTESLVIERRGLYQATLTDFAFPESASEMRLSITTATDTLATLPAPGQSAVDMQPGEYFLNFYAIAASAPTAVAARFSPPDANAGRDVFASRVHDPEAPPYGIAARPGAAITGFDFGQYGIEISLSDSAALTNVSAVPLPAAGWMMLGGIALFGSVPRRKR